MRILGLCGSPMINGNTEILLDHALEGAKNKGAEVEKVILNTLNFVPCQECEEVRDDGICLINDDMQMVYRKIDEANAIILASPIFFGTLTAQTKMMIDRFQCLWLAKYRFSTRKSDDNRLGAFICVEATSRKDFFENARAIVKNLFVTIDTIYKEELLSTKIEGKGMILRDKESLEKAFEIGERIVNNCASMLI